MTDSSARFPLCKLVLEDPQPQTECQSPGMEEWGSACPRILVQKRTDFKNWHNKEWLSKGAFRHGIYWFG